MNCTIIFYPVLGLNPCARLWPYRHYRDAPHRRSQGGGGWAFNSYNGLFQCTHKPNEQRIIIYAVTLKRTRYAVKKYFPSKSIEWGATNLRKTSIYTKPPTPVPRLSLLFLAATLTTTWLSVYRRRGHVK